MTAIALAAPAPDPRDVPAVLQRELGEDWLRGKSPATIAAYRGDLRQLALWLELPGGEQATLGYVTRLSSVALNGLALRWRGAMTEAGLSSSTTNRRLASLRSAVRFARMLGMTSATIDVAGVRPEPRRDSRGPTATEFRTMLEALERRPDHARKLRLRAMLLCLGVLGLRRGEVLGLDREHWADGRLMVKPKGRRERHPLTVPPLVATALDRWCASWPAEDGPLFVTLRGRTTGARLSATAFAGSLKVLGRQAGLERPVRPHGLRHCAVTCALDTRDGDLRAVRRFSRHASLSMLLVYDDDRTDTFGEIARAVEAALVPQAVVEATNAKGGA